MKRTAPLRRSKPIRKVSLKRARQLREYSARRTYYLREHPVCEVWLREHQWFWNRTHYSKQISTHMIIHCTPAELIERYHAPSATEIHHTNKRRGAMLNDERHWLAVCRENHQRIENDKSWARANGFLLNF